jgi:hypothetical protein
MWKQINFMLFFSFVLGIQAISGRAQRVYTVDCPSQAVLKVFVVAYESQANLLVNFVKYESQAFKNGMFFPVKYESQADFKIYFTDDESQADLKIFIVDNRSKAGWGSKSEQYLLKFRNKVDNMKVMVRITKPFGWKGRR